MSKPLTIGVLARDSGVNLETIRFYERSGLMPAPQRSPSGYRHYQEQDVRRLRFIRRGRELGFVILPWKLENNYVFGWLNGYGALLGPIGGPEELLPFSPRSQYLVGHIAPVKLAGTVVAESPAVGGGERGDLVEIREDADGL